MIASSSRGGLGDNSRSWSNGAEVDRLIEDLKLNWKNAGGVTAEDAVQEGGQSYTLDWLAPEALPFFVGVNL